ncbi:DUF943 family protein [Enterobacter genomosp. S]|uniref:DUF943 family protein n=1 Tax=Enterobacter genomosp. S TaxID=2364151 RepID=A0ABR5YNB0_9ENTR|nr:DUF943 family protein [Enterobacter genomosp. S]KZR31460.1 hypothetical protein A3466_02815 [Enterobacter genomosp. S]
MNSKSKVVIGSLVLLIFSYLLWTQRPVTVIRAGSQVEYYPTFVLEQFASKDRRFESYDIVVNHFPLTEWGRIHWYLEHKEELKKIYNIPSSDSYTITFWDIGSGFADIQTSSDGDLYCFPPKNDTEKHCIEKNILLDVEFDTATYERFSFSGSEYYWITMPDGKLVRIKNAL